MHKAIDADYYGFRDEDDGVLLRVEGAAERRIKRQVGFNSNFELSGSVAAVGLKQGIKRASNK